MKPERPTAVFPPFHVYLYGPARGPLTGSFDAIAQRLAQLPRLHFEPDGSLLLSGERWQLGGMIYDREGIIQYAELQGCCPLVQWRSVVRQITHSPQTATVLQLIDQSLHDLQTFEERTWPTG